MTSAVYEAPAEVREVTDSAIRAARQAAAQVTLSLAAIEVAESIVGQRPLGPRQVRVIATHTYDDDSLTGRMMGGAVGRAWARQTILGEADGAIRAMVAAAAASEVEALRERSALTKMADKLNRIDQRFRSKVEGVMSQAMRRAEKHAQTKATVRAGRATKAKLASVADDLEARRFTPAVLAAISTTDEELLGGMFDDAAEEVQALYEERQAARRKALLAGLAGFGLTADDLARSWDGPEEQRAVALGAFVAAALFVEARSRLQSGLTSEGLYPAEGEVPFDASVPGAIVAATMRVADGSAVQADGSVAATALLERPHEPLADHGDPLVADTINAVVPGGVRMVYTWQVGDPARPFEPHQELAGLTFDQTEYVDVCGKDPGEFPYGSVAYQPGDHAGCFPAGTMVSGPRAHSATTRWYEGEMVYLTLASGKFLTATPNHPILTDGRGWVAAGLLNEGDSVVRCQGADRIGALVPHDQQMPARIEQVAGSLGEAAGVVPRAVPVAAEDFHGDGVGSEVAVVRTNRLLSDRLDAALREPPGEQRFVPPDVLGAVPLFGGSHTGQGLVGVGAPSFGRVGSLDEPGVLLRGAGSSVGPVGLGLPSDGYAVPLEAQPDGGPADAEPLGESGHRIASLVGLHHLLHREAEPDRVVRFGVPSDADAETLERLSDGAATDAMLEAEARQSFPTLDVALDEVVGVRRNPAWAGHVYNLGTAGGWYIADGIIAHNCQCWLDIEYVPEAESGTDSEETPTGVPIGPIDGLEPPEE